MGTHPIFESDFDCLTEMADQEIPAEDPIAEEETEEETGPIHPATFELPDLPYEELNRLQQRWFKIKAIKEFPFKVSYYGDCGLPLEYCEFLPEQLRVQAMEEASRDDDVDQALVSLDITDDDKKKQKRGGRGNVKAKKKTEPCAIKIGRVSRGKKKSVTHITGLGSYDVDLKKTAKMFGNKFACGASSNEKADEIIIQGDFIDECIELILSKFPQIEEDKIVDLGDIKK